VRACTCMDSSNINLLTILSHLISTWPDPHSTGYVSILSFVIRLYHVVHCFVILLCVHNILHLQHFFDDRCNDNVRCARYVSGIYRVCHSIWGPGSTMKILTGFCLPFFSSWVTIYNRHAKRWWCGASGGSAT
jgi:hypothetical protein